MLRKVLHSKLHMPHVTVARAATSLAGHIKEDVEGSVIVGKLYRFDADGAIKSTFQAALPGGTRSTARSTARSPRPRTLISPTPSAGSEIPSCRWPERKRAWHG
ncbi:MAG: hypothetical protein IT437_12440 [Phycisphaerales bacterium]|nr:hypothetical protein [Phycisphaerales bacterium]